MEKKIYNWLGYTLILLYILIFIILFYIANQHYHISRDFILLPTLWLMAMVFLIPITLNRTWCKVLPEKRIHTKIIAKGAIPVRWSVNGHFYSASKLFLTFEVPDGSRMALPVKSNVYNTVLVNEVGILFFRGQGNRNYFVKFEKFSNNL